jgi:hypothetical protein
MKPEVIWEPETVLTYGAIVDEELLKAEASVPGRYVSYPPLGNELPIGAPMVSLYFIPEDTKTYGSVVMKKEFTVKKAPLVITTKDESRGVGQPNPDFKIVYEGFVKGEGRNGLSSLPTAHTDATVDSEPGEYDVVVSGAAALNYEIIHKAGVLRIIGPPVLYVDGAKVQGNEVLKYDSAMLKFEGGFEDGSIIYTLDGSDPASGGKTYSKPVKITEQVLVNAISYDSSFSNYVAMDKVVKVIVRPTYGITVTESGGGSVYLEPELDRYPAGEVVTITAEPDKDWTLSSWRGLDGSKRSNIITVSRDLVVEARFATGITFSAIGQGEVSLEPSKTLYGHGETISILAKPKLGWVFERWGGGLSGSANPKVLKVEEPNLKAIAVFSELDKELPEVSWAVPAVISYGEALGEKQLNATANVGGVFEYDPPAGTVFGAGVHRLGLRFEPNDLVKYISVSKEVQLTVEKAPLEVMVSGGLRPYGESNPEFVLVYDGFVNGDTVESLISKPFVQTSASELSEPGSYEVKILGGQSDNYEFSFKNGTLTVFKEAPEIVWEVPETIPYGTKLEEVYTAKAKMKGEAAEFQGTYKYTPEETAILEVGEHTIQVVFEPDNSTNFEPIRAERPVRVVPSKLQVVALDAERVYGEQNPDFDYKVEGAYVEEDMEELGKTLLLTTSAGPESNAGTYTIEIGGGDGGGNYEVEYVRGLLTVTKRVPNVVWNTETELVYGARMDEELLNAESDVLGQLTSTPELGVLLPVGVVELNLAFVPEDKGNYEEVLLKKELNVKKAMLTIRVQNTTKGVGFKNPDFEIVYEGFIEGEGPSDLANQPTVLTDAKTDSPIGEYSVVVSGAASENYEITHISGSLSVMEKLALELEVVGGGAINVIPEQEYYAFDEEVILAVIPDEWYEFKQWDDGNTDNPRFIKPSEKHVFTAILEPTVELETQVFGDVERVAPVGMPTFFINGEYVPEQGVWTIPDLAMIKITSTFEAANILYSINDGDEQFYTEPFEIKENAIITATAFSVDFSKSVESKVLNLKVRPKLNLNLFTKGGGNVSSEPQKSNFLQGESVVLSGAAEEGWTLIGWQLNGVFHESKEIKHTFVQDLVAEAVFGTKFTLRAIPPDAGEMTLSVSKSYYSYGENVQVQGKAKEGFYLASVSGQGFPSVTVTPANYDVTIASPSLAGLFLKLPGGLVNLNAMVNGNGKIGVVENASTKNTYNKNTEIVLKADAGEGSIFTGWSGDVESGQATINLKMDSSKTLTANFSSGYVIEINAEKGRVTKEPNLDTYSAGAKVILRPVPDDGFGFVGWEGDITGTDELVELTMDKDYSIKALFGKAYIIDREILEGKGRIVSDPDRERFLEGTTVSLEAVPEAGFEFVEWSYGGNILKTPRIPPFEITENLSYQAKFKDVQAPRVTILEPIGGVTGNENISLRGLLTDNGTLESVTWMRWDENQGVLELTEDKFDLKGIVLLKGDNSYSVIARDTGGNVSTETVNVTWEPLRTLELVDAPERQEGKRINIPLKLASNGDVGGMTFILNYDKQVLKDPILVWSSAAGTSINSVNTDVPGEVKATFSLVGSGLPEGDQLIATVSFRIRSVPATMYTDYSLEVLDMSMTDGSQVNFGTHVDPGTARLLRRKYNGDTNGNDRLDIGDGTLVQRLLTGFDEQRSWDSSGNDLNGNGKLDSGDVILLLRTVVGLDKQPSDGNRDIAKMNPRPVIRMGGPDDEPVEMASIRLVEKTASRIKVQVVSENLESAMSGIAFTLHYPVDKLRLKDQKAHSVGEIVPNDAVRIWNVFPSQNDYIKQTGKVRLALSNVEQWELANGVLAEFELEVVGGADLSVAELSLSEVELTPTGYDNRMLPDVVLGLGEEAKPPVIVALSNKLPFGFSFESQKGKGYVVEATDDLRKWNLVETIQGTGTAVQFTDKREALFERQYYRLKVE